MLTKFLCPLRNLQIQYNHCLFATHAVSKKPATTTITADLILSTENRNRCMECLKKTPPIGIKLKQSKEQDTYAAVLIAICRERNNNLSILYTRRSGNLSRHVRQISFPGGIMDSDTDTDFVDCALRETEEEIGLPTERIEIWGTGSLITPPNTAAIMPVIGMVEDFELSELTLNTDEVDDAFLVPLTTLADPANLFHTQFKSGYSAPNFVVGPYKIWGVTGFMTNIFLNCLLPPELNAIKGCVKFVTPFKAN